VCECVCECVYVNVCKCKFELCESVFARMSVCERECVFVCACV